MSILFYLSDANEKMIFLILLINLGKKLGLYVVALEDYAKTLMSVI